MYNVSSGFLTNIKDANIAKKGRVVIGSTTLDESNIVYFKIDESFGSGNRPAIAGVAAAKLTLELINTGTLPTIVGQAIKPAVAIDVNGSDEWVELGVFYAEQNDVKLNPDGLSYTIECFDNLARLDRFEYESSISFPATLSNFLSDIATTYSLQFETQTLPSVSITSKPSGTVRQVLGEVASLISRNVTLSRSSAANIGKLKFVFSNSTSFSIDGNSYYDLTLLSENSISISKLILEGTDLYSGTSSGYSLSFSNSQVTTQAELDTVYNRFFPFSYTPFTLSSYGFPHLETGDLISVTDNDNTTRTLLICGHSFLYDGGFESALIAEIANDTEYSSSADGGSNLVNTVNRATELITGNKGGFITTVLNEEGKPEEFVISNTSDYKTALRVWRWNASGLGYSSTGYNGSYDLAMTSDGEIVADFIKAGELSTANWNDNIIPANTGVINMYSGQMLSSTIYDSANKEEISIGQKDAIGNQSLDFLTKTNGLSITSTTNITSFTVNGATGTSGTNIITVTTGGGLVQIGYTISGTGIPANTTITDAIRIGYNTTQLTLSAFLTSSISGVNVTLGVPSNASYRVVRINYATQATAPYPNDTRVSIEGVSEIINGDYTAQASTTSSTFISVYYNSAVPNTSGLGKIYGVSQKLELYSGSNTYKIDFLPKSEGVGGNGYLTYSTDNNLTTPTGKIELFVDTELSSLSNGLIKNYGKSINLESFNGDINLTSQKKNILNSNDGTEVNSSLKVSNGLTVSSGGATIAGDAVFSTGKVNIGGVLGGLGSKLDVRSDITTTPLTIRTGAQSNNTSLKAIELFSDNSAGASSIDFIRGSASSNGGIGFSVSTAGTKSEAMRIRNDGFIGIGLTNPAEKLDVSGNIKSSGSITAGNGFTLSSGTFSLPNNSITSAMIDSLDAAELTGTVAFARLPIDMQSGTHTFSSVAAGATVSQSVTFTSGRFAAAPYISTGILTTAPSANYRASVSGISATGFTLYFYNGQSTSVTVTVHWIAMRE